MYVIFCKSSNTLELENYVAKLKNDDGVHYEDVEMSQPLI